MPATRLFALLAATCLWAAAQAAQGEETAARPPAQASSQSLCLLMESAAAAHGLPTEFFVRLIWQESRFRADAVGPVTRSGDRARGIAQFMPRTAGERGLLDPFDPIQALPKSAEFLAELAREFGNLGLAAAAYNAGPQRVRDYLAGKGEMPSETRAYVMAITGAPVEDWATNAAERTREPNKASCEQLTAGLRASPGVFIARLEERIARAASAPWGVQLSAGFSRDRALSSYARVQNRHGRILGGHDPIIQASRLLSRGTRTFYQVRAGAPTRVAADALCNAVRKDGGACLVLKNRG